MCPVTMRKALTWTLIYESVTGVALRNPTLDKLNPARRTLLGQMADIPLVFQALAEVSWVEEPGFRDILVD